MMLCRLWSRIAAKTTGAKTTSAPSPAPRQKRAATPSDDLVDSALNTTGVGTPKQRAKRRTGGSPSTSPPAALPSVEYMQEGYDADDIWIMVEDEFYTTAQTFTQHIHHAEYVRLKKLAKARGANTLQAIARPTDGRTEQSMSTKIRLEAEAQERKAQAGLKGLLAGSDEEEEDRDAYMHDPQLAGLMTGSQKVAPDLTGTTKPRANTRAAAGFLQSPQKARRQRKILDENASNDADSGSDLDSGLPAKRQQPSRAHTAGVTTADRKKVANPQPKTNANGFFKRFASDSDDRESGSRPDGTTAHHPDERRVRSSQATEQLLAGPSKLSEPVSPFNVRSQATADFLAKRRAREAVRQKNAKKEEKQKSTSSIDVPTFLL
ncbi:hypothetical protein LTR78_002015 [Recurvomyces mirabilis]|uniref:Uncharacterized protein n=1 Tax=Recurvomyces mirabilis TaxID=574656 RepID=A0AAE0WTK4_9PEZI|nr:hypothetical protein LTR78_002015 [Recurvomyces mirabilis]KAK5160473.1 hypothetical protein LTS14_001485 [Recurvomyces mirabilis]